MHVTKLVVPEDLSRRLVQEIFLSLALLRAIINALSLLNLIKDARSDDKEFTVFVEAQVLSMHLDCVSYGRN